MDIIVTDVNLDNANETVSILEQAGWKGSCGLLRCDKARERSRGGSNLS